MKKLKTEFKDTPASPQWSQLAVEEGKLRTSIIVNTTPDPIEPSSSVPHCLLKRPTFAECRVCVTKVLRTVVEKEAMQTPLDPALPLSSARADRHLPNLLYPPNNFEELLFSARPAPDLREEFIFSILVDWSRCGTT